MELQIFSRDLEGDIKQISERFRTNIQIKYHNVIKGMNPMDNKNHEAINTIINAKI